MIDQQYPRTLNFSYTYKHANCQKSEDGKIVELSGGYNYCLCGQAIRKTGKINIFAFQMISGTAFFVEIGFRDIIMSELYMGVKLNHNRSFMIRDNGYAYSHHSRDVNAKQLSFVFTINDIIIMEVSFEHKQIKWTQYNNSQAAISKWKQIHPYHQNHIHVEYCQFQGQILDNIPDKKDNEESKIKKTYISINYNNIFNFQLLKSIKIIFS